MMKTALLLIDIQNDYFDGGAMTLVGSREASENARLLLDKFRAGKQTIIHVQHIATRPDATFFLPDTAGAEINDTVKPMGSEKVVVKNYPNSFRETDLLAYLQSTGVTDLVVCGMMTHMCIDATVRAAKDLDFKLTLIGDACATRDLEIEGERVPAKAVHNSFLAALNGTYATVTSCKYYLESN